VENQQQLLRRLPSVDELLGKAEVIEWAKVYSRSMVVEGVRYAIQEIRQMIQANQFTGSTPTEELIIKRIGQWLDRQAIPNLRRVINATGVVLHTNLGRAPLAREAIEAIKETAQGYCNLEYNLETGERGSRYDHVEQLLVELTGAESALVVNNNAAAVILVLGAMAYQKEVIISRGQLVEIGGSFRIPDVMLQSGAKLVEVGATNKTHVTDYTQAITEETGLLLRVHTSNFRMIGFTAEVSSEQLAQIGKQYGIPVYEDQGSGMLFRLPGAPESDLTVGEAIAAGIDVVSFSGDKLLGSTQAGIIVGKKEFVDQMKRHPLLRALRMDKLSLAALEATLRLYRKGDPGMKNIPFVQMLTASKEELIAKAECLDCGLKRDHASDAVQIVDVVGRAGGGSLPEEEIPSVAVALTLPHIGLHEAVSILRQARIPVICRIAEERLLFDLRTVASEEIAWIVEACSSLSQRRWAEHGK
jgi:L-seryl-tRNA(Ser) seleniumtransferase